MRGAVIHPTAIVSPASAIGDGAAIGPYSIVDSGAVVGDGTKIESFVHITSFVDVGRDCHIFENTVIGAPPQDHDFRGENSRVRISDEVVIRENVTIHRATGDGCVTSVGRGSWLMEGCHLGHNVSVGEYCTLTNKSGLSGYVQMGDYVVVGGMAGFHQFVRVGSHSMIGGLAKVVMDVPPYSMVDGNPASMIGLNSVGLRRRGFTQEQRARIKRIYKLLFECGKRWSEALELVAERFGGDGFAEEVMSFMRDSKRGVYHWQPGAVTHRGRGK